MGRVGWSGYNNVSKSIIKKTSWVFKKPREREVTEDTIPLQQPAGWVKSTVATLMT